MKPFVVLGAPEVAGGYLPHLLLGAYMVLLVWLCYLGYRKGKSTEEDYYLAGRGQGLLVSALTIMATMFSSAALLGIPGTVYRDGLAFVPFAMNLTVGGLGIYFLGTRMNRLGKARGYVTPADMIGEYYGGTSIRILAVSTGVLYVLPYVIMQIKAGGYLAERLFPDAPPIHVLGREFDMFDTGVWVLSLLTMAYVLVGGMRSVAWTDVVQGLLLLTGMLVAGLATVLYFQSQGGFFRAVSTLPPEALTMPGVTGKWNPWMIFSICTIVALGAVIQPGQWMRFYAARSVKTLRQCALIFAVVLPTCFIFGIMVVALGARVEFPPSWKAPVDELQAAEAWQGDGDYAEGARVRYAEGLFEAKGKVSSGQVFEPENWNPVQKLYPHEALGPEPSDTDKAVIVMTQLAVPEVFGAVFGSIVVTIILVAVLAASMSTADSNLHALSAVLTRDVYDRYVSPDASERQKTWFGRAVIVVATICAVALVEFSNESSGFNPLKLITQLMLLALSFCSQLLPVAIDVLFLNKGTRAGAVAGLSTGIAIVVLLNFFPEYSLGVTSVLHLCAVGVLANALVFILVSRFTRKVPGDRVEQFRRIIRGER